MRHALVEAAVRTAVQRDQQQGTGLPRFYHGEHTAHRGMQTIELILIAQKFIGRKEQRVKLGGTARRVFLAQDADPRVTEPIELLCREQGTETEAVATMAALGSACGIAVGSAVAAVVD